MNEVERAERQKRIDELEKSLVYAQATPGHIVQAERAELAQLRAEEQSARKDEIIIVAIKLLHELSQSPDNRHDAMREQITGTRDRLEDVVETSDLPLAPRERKMVRQARARAQAMS